MLVTCIGPCCKKTPQNKQTKPNKKSPNRRPYFSFQHSVVVRDFFLVKRFSSFLIVSFHKHLVLSPINTRFLYYTLKFSAVPHHCDLSADVKGLQHSTEVCQFTEDCMQSLQKPERCFGIVLRAGLRVYLSLHFSDT